MNTNGSAFKARHQKGFTLIELLIVVVIIGVLAAIAIPKFTQTKEKVYLAAMKSDLRNLVTAQEEYFADNTTYTSSIAALDFGTSTSITLAITIDATPPVGFSAIATHTATAETCAIFIQAPLQAPAIQEGAPRCT